MNNLTRVAVILFYLDLTALIVFGKAYSKFQILSLGLNTGHGLFAHDMLLLIIATLCLVQFRWRKSRLFFVEFVIVISLIYLAYSFIIAEANNYFYVIRQYSIFGYMAIVYIITKHFFEEGVLKNTPKIILFLGFSSILIQLIYSINLYLLDSLDFNQRNAYSPMIKMGIIFFSVYVVTSSKINTIYKAPLFVFCFLISLTIGHDSVYLSMVLSASIYIFIISSKKLKFLISFVLIVLFFITMNHIPSFTDVNANWRLIFWEDMAKRITDNYFFIGEGFGVNLVSEETLIALNNLMSHHGYNASLVGEERFTNGPHNSFLSIAFHNGLISLLTLFSPLFYYAFKLWPLKKNLFIMLVFLGISVLSFFNVILELPHTSSVYWLVFFYLMFELKSAYTHQSE